MGFDVNLFSDSERAAAQKVYEAWNDGERIVELIIPEKITEGQEEPEVASS